MGILGGGNTCIKYMLFFFNLLFWLIGIALIAAGIYALVGDVTKHFKNLDDAKEIMEAIRSAAIVVIVIGVIILVVAFLGCCGAIRESQCMLFTFFIFLLVILVLLIAAGIFTLVYGPEKLIGKIIKAQLKLVKEQKDDFEGNMWLATIEKERDCCGDKGPQDYEKGKMVSKDCYLLVKSKVPTVAHEGSEFNKAGLAKLKTWPTSDVKDTVPGCSKELYSWFKDKKLWIGLIALIFGLCMFMGIVLSLCLCCAIRRATDV